MSDRLIVEQHWDIRYQHPADDVAARFFETLRDEKRLVGIRCPKCERVLIPPRPFCDRDFVETDGWVDVANEGVIELFTVVYLKTPGLPDPPYAIAYVRPDGADTAIMNLVKGVDLSEPAAAADALAIGGRLRAEFIDERQGRISDFYYVPA